MHTTPSTLSAIRDHAAEAYPEEGCGFLIGTVTNGENRVTGIVRAANRHPDHRERRYAIPPDAYQAADAEARARGEDIVGFYHSHPDHPARPSETDLQEATFPGYTYVIVSVDNGTPAALTAWSLRDDRSAFDEESITEVQGERQDERPKANGET